MHLGAGGGQLQPSDPHSQLLTACLELSGRGASHGAGQLPLSPSTPESGIGCQGPLRHQQVPQGRGEWGPSPDSPLGLGLWSGV